MKKLLIKTCLIIFLFFPISCGFKIIDKTEFNNFSIKNITTTGDKRINFKIRNDLMMQSLDDNTNSLTIDLKSEKIKTIKEKNIKNEITKYQILIKTEVEFNLIGESSDYRVSVSSSGDYVVAESYSTTLSNEKELIDDLVKGLSEKILSEINLKLNDL